MQTTYIYHNHINKLSHCNLYIQFVFSSAFDAFENFAIPMSLSISCFIRFSKFSNSFFSFAVICNFV